MKMTKKYFPRILNYKLLALPLVAVMTQACTIHWSGMVDNESSTNIKVVGNDAKQTSWNVNANEEVKISWKFKCLQVDEAGKSYYFDANVKSVPKGALKGGGMSYTVYTVYREHQLYYMIEGGKVQPLAKLDSCSE